MVFMNTSDYTRPLCKKQGFLPPPLRSFALQKGMNLYIFVDCDEISLENNGFALAFCAIFLYNDFDYDVGGVSAWGN